MSDPAIGVVIPCRDYERFLPDCLESVAWQGLDCRVVVVDDASADPQAVEKAAGSTPVLHLPEHRGLGLARNIGAAYLDSDYLLFLDADDTLYPARAGELWRALEAEPHAAFAYGNYTQAGQTIITAPWDIEYLKAQNVASYCNLWRRTAFWEIGGYTDVPVAEDWDLQTRAMSASQRGIHVATLVFDHRLHDNNKWTRDAAQYGGLEGVSAWLRQYASRG